MVSKPCQNKITFPPDSLSHTRTHKRYTPGQNTILGSQEIIERSSFFTNSPRNQFPQAAATALAGGLNFQRDTQKHGEQRMHTRSMIVLFIKEIKKPKQNKNNKRIER